MTNDGRHPTVKRKGRKPGQPRRIIDPATYPALIAMADEGWGWSAIGKRFGITGTHVARLIRAHRGDI